MGIKPVSQPPYRPDVGHCDFGYSLSSVAVVMRHLRRWKRQWRRLLTRSHKRTSMGPFRSCWNGTTSALQPEEITSKGLEFHVCTINKSVHTKKVWKLIVCTSYITGTLAQRLECSPMARETWVQSQVESYQRL